LQVRDALGLSAHSKCAAFGIQLANYRQLKDAVKFFRDNGVKVTESIPAELHPGIEYSATVRIPMATRFSFTAQWSKSAGRASRARGN
jgi:hypothetical protein